MNTLRKSASALVLGVAVLIVTQGFVIRELRSGNESCGNCRADHDPQLPVSQPVSLDPSGNATRPRHQLKDLTTLAISADVCDMPNAVEQGVDRSHSLNRTSD